MNFFTWFNRWRQKQTSKRQLHAMTDQALRDIGLSRGEINYVIDNEYRDKC